MYASDEANAARVARLESVLGTLDEGQRAGARDVRYLALGYALGRLDAEGKPVDDAQVFADAYQLDWCLYLRGEQTVFNPAGPIRAAWQLWHVG